MVAETNGDKGVRFSPNILQALRGYNVVVLQGTGAAFPQSRSRRD